MPAASPPARVQPADRSRARPGARGPVRTRRSPDLAPDRGTPVGLVVAVLRRDAREQVFERIPRLLGCDDQPAALDTQRHGRPFLDLHLYCIRARNAQAEAVAPLLYLG